MRKGKGVATTPTPTPVPVAVEAPVAEPRQEAIEKGKQLLKGLLSGR